MIVAGSPLVGCSHAWEDYDPRLAGSGGAEPTTSGTGGMGASTGGAGGMGAGAGGMGGQGAGGSGGGVVDCGGTSALAADFSGNTLGGLWDAGDWGGATISETGGEIVVSLPMGSADESGGYLKSEHYYDFRGDFVSVEVTSAADPSSSAWAYLVVTMDENNYVEIYQESGFLFFGREIGNSYTELAKIQYDPIAHRFWQLRESGGDTYFETSPDGQNWAIRAQTPTADLFPVDLVQVVLGGGANSGQASPGEARFDKLNGGGAPKQKYCPMSSLTDDFADGAESMRWARSWEEQNGMLAEQDGQFVIHYVPNAEAYAGLVSASAFDLTSSSIVIEVPVAPPESAQAHIGLELNGPLENDVEMVVEQGKLKFGVEIADTHQELGSVLYSAQDHRWWRIREASNTLYWETAPDGKTWTTRMQVSPPPVPINVLDIEIHAGTWAAQPALGDCRADNVNLPPL